MIIYPPTTKHDLKIVKASSNESCGHSTHVMSCRAERTRSLGSFLVTVIRYPCGADRTGLLGSLLGNTIAEVNFLSSNRYYFPLGKPS